MPIFRRETPPPGAAQSEAQASSASPPGTGSRLARGLKLRGSLSGGEDLVVEGEVEGCIELSGQLTVAAGGLVTGPVEARAIRVHGRVVGDLKASDLVELSPSGSLEGGISAARVVFAEGAFFRGEIEMQGRSKGAARQPSTPGSKKLG